MEHQVSLCFIVRYGSGGMPIALGMNMIYPQNNGHFLFTRFKEMSHALGMDAQFAPKNPSSNAVVMVKWKAPPQGWTMLNIDGASWGNSGVAAGGGVIRGDLGE